jgi:Flp pilus assembly protein TadD
VNLCAVLQKLGRFPEAVNHGRDAVRLRPQQADAHTNLAVALEAVGRIDEAAAEYAAAARLGSESADAHANLGRILLAQDSRRRGRAGIAKGAANSAATAGRFTTCWAARLRRPISLTPP